ncbi:hypothetical protein SAMN03159424_04310 [Pseudomonas sp. NFACC05-1]|nr:hypothetical protein SAMN03159424_04310 [Pseudomonas sp. NFACC05-1]
MVPLLQRLTFEKRKSKQNAFAPPLGASPRLGMPERRHCSVGRREGPSMAQRGYPGIHAGMPTAQCLRSASVVNGAPKSTSTARRPYSRPGSAAIPRSNCGSGLAREGGLPAGLFLPVAPRSHCTRRIAPPSKRVGRRSRILISINCNSIVWPYSPLHVVFMRIKKPICSVWSQNAEHVDLSRV